MNELKTMWEKLRGWGIRRRVQLALSLRVTLGAVLAWVAAQLLGLPLPLWAVLTAVIVTQLSLGRSLKTTGDYLLGTLGGAAYGGMIAVLIPHAGEAALLGVLVLAVAPLALLAAVRPNLNVAPITAIIVLLLPTLTHASPLASAIDRVLEVALGAVVGLLVSFLVFPSSAHRQLRRSGAATLELMAEALGALLAGLRQGLDVEALHRLQDGIGRSLMDIATIAQEAERERRARLAEGPETGPLNRTLLRLRHDLVIVGRAAATRLPEPLQARLASSLDAAAKTTCGYLLGSARALREGQPPAPLQPVTDALDAYGREVEAARHEGLTRALDGDAAERFFAVGFALEQLHQNLRDLERVVREWAAGAPQ